jgi:N utilization substance protein B
VSTRGRHGARRLLLQALYQRQIAGQDVATLRAQFAQSGALADADADYFFMLLDEVLEDSDSLDARIDAHADRPVTQIDPVERAVLWIGMVELSSHPEIPPGVTINEAVELAKEFGGEDSYRYVNAILDGAARELR